MDREEAIEVVKTCYERMLKDNFLLDMKDEVMMRIDDAFNTLMSPIQFEWIPVNKRLPERGDEVLVSKRYHFFDTDKDEIDVDKLYYSGTNEFGAVFHDKFGNYARNVIAWMPLPQSYKED